MKFTIPRETLLTPLQQVVGVIEKRQTMPILSNVLMTFGEGWIELTGTDLEIQLVARAQTDMTVSGSVTVPAKKLLDIIRLLPDRSPLQIECKEDRFSIRCGGGRYTLATLPVENYPAFDSGASELEVLVPADALRTALDKTMFAMAQQDVRYYLNGILLDLEGATLRTVSSDGHRLALYQETFEAPFASNRQVIIPRKGVQELARLLADADDTLTIRIAPNTIGVDLGAISFSAKLVEGRFPDFRRVLPSELNRFYKVDRDELKRALTRVSVLSDEKIKTISLEISDDGVMQLKTHKSEQEDAEEQLSVDAEGGGVSVGFNAHYLLDAVNNVDSDVAKLSFTESASSCLIEDAVDTRFKSIVMPMRL